MDENIIYTKSKAFALRIINLFKYLTENKEFVLSKQILRSGTSVGANVAEGLFAQSKADFIAKLQIALKEAGETRYWLELLFEANYINQLQYSSLYDDCQELISILVSILKTTKGDRVF